MDIDKEQTLTKEKSSLIITLVSIVATILSSLVSTGQVTEIFKIVDLTSTVTQIIIGIVVAIIVSVALFLIEKVHKKK